MPDARGVGFVGVKVATEPATAYVTFPVTATPVATFVSVKLDGLIVEGFSASLKVALTAWLVGTLVAKLAGFVAITAGAVGAGTVKKVQGFATPLDPSGVPARSVAPAAIL